MSVIRQVRIPYEPLLLWATPRTLTFAGPVSHVVDFALSSPGEGSFHEVHKMRYVKTTAIPEIREQSTLPEPLFRVHYH